MNLFSVAEKLSPSDHAPIALNANRCVHSYDRFSKCDICIRACPVDALRLDAPIALDEQVCVACGLCLRVCPVGALTGDDGVADLLNLTARLPEAAIIELACSRHPAPEQGALENATVIRTNTCLAALGPSCYLQWLTRPIQVIVRLDACAECSLKRAQPTIEQTVQSVRAILTGRGAGERVIAVTAKPESPSQPRPVYDTKNPPVSRRDLFRFIVAEGSKAADVQAIVSDQPTGKVPPLERRRLLKMLEQFTPNESMPTQNVPALGLGWVSLKANENCSACGVCARTCPTGAMQFAATDDNQYRLALRLNHCTDCGVCIDMCEPGALQRDGVANLTDLFATEPKILRAGRLKECVKCKAKFAADIAGNLCPICQYRHDHPFGSRLPRRSEEVEPK